MQKVLFLMVILSLVSSCGTDDVNSRKKTQATSIGDVTFTCNYVSPEELALNNGVSDDPDAIESYENHLYFRLRLEAENSTDFLKHNLSSETEYYDRISYYSHSIKNDLSLISGNDTLDCIDVHMERNFGVAPFLVIGLIFPRVESNETVTLRFVDRVFGSGPINFKYQLN